MSAAEKLVAQQISIERISVATMAQQALEETGGDVQAASRLLEKMARQNNRTWKALTAKALPECCYNAVRDVCRKDRRAIWTAPNYNAGGNGSRVSAHADRLMDFPLPGGIPLRDATAKDLHAAADFYREQADDMAHKSRWLEAIAAKVGRKKVGNALTEKQLKALRDGAE